MIGTRVSRIVGLSLALVGAALAGAATPRAVAAHNALQACRLPHGLLPAEKRVVFVLDTSGSMRGIGDGRANIFTQVKKSMDRYVQDVKPDQVELITFDQGVRQSRSYRLPDDLPTWKAELGALRADGQNTYLYRSLEKALQPLTGAQRYITSVFVLTDGIDNDQDQRFGAQQALAAFTGRGRLDTLAYLALGTQIPREAREALETSDYASGWTLAVGQVPNLLALTGSTRLADVTDPTRVPAPFADGTPLKLVSEVRGLDLSTPTAQRGLARLRAPAQLPYGTPALLCAPPDSAPNVIAPKLRRMLLAVNLGDEPQFMHGLTWLNPGADRSLAVGEEVVLRYRATRAWPISDPQTTLQLPPENGLVGQLGLQPGALEFAVRLRHLGPGTAQHSVTPFLQPAGGRSLPLPAITLEQGAPVAWPGKGEGVRFEPRRWLGPLLGLGLLMGLLAGWSFWGGELARWWGGRIRQKAALDAEASPLPKGLTVKGLSASAAAQRLSKITSLGKLTAPSRQPLTDGLEYREDRTLALVTRHGEVSPLVTPLGGPFDIGRLARVPLLSGLRAEQHRDGLLLLSVPADLEVSQGSRLYASGDLVRPGSLLGVTIAPVARAPHGPLGQLVGLGLPLTLKADGVTLNVVGPYGQHAVTLEGGITDLGEAFISPALSGLMVSTRGPHILLADLPDGMAIHRLEDDAPLRPGTYLPGEAQLRLPEG